MKMKTAYPAALKGFVASAGNEDTDNLHICSRCGYEENANNFYLASDSLAESLEQSRNFTHVKVTLKNCIDASANNLKEEAYMSHYSILNLLR
jgi:DNA-directed RNA polymerase subunit M/transcription elongation factor TFIIS